VTTRALHLRELDPWRVEHLSPAQVEWLQTSGVVDVRPAGRRWEVRARGLVGACRVGDLEVHVAPKIRIERLLFLLGYITRASIWRDEQVQLDMADGLLAAAAEALSRQVDVALRRGVLQGYVTVEDALPTIRGRIREADQLRRRFATPLPVEIRFDDYTVDIPENRILRAAVERMAALPGVSERARHRLSRSRARLIEASPLVPGAPVPAWRPTRLNARYVPALRLAELVLAATSWEHADGEVPVTGFLVNMTMVFEAFVCTALGEEIAARGGLARTQDTSRTLDDDGLVDLRPDLVWYTPDMHPVALVDAKYKAERYDGFPNADIYQLLAYCTAFGLARGHLVYARGNEEPRRYSIRSAGVEVVAHCLDLEASPDALLAQVAELAEGIGGEGLKAS
jgi:5-methylcytosine-specific restriction enzyme subunit McrC